MPRTSHTRADAPRTSCTEIVAIAAVIIAAVLWCAAISYAQDASWQRYVEAGCPRPAAAEAAAYERFLTDELG